MDNVANMLVALKNGLVRKQAEILVPFSNFKYKIAEILVAEGYLLSAGKEVRDNKTFLKLVPKYASRKPVIQGLKRISKPGRRIYLPRRDLRSAQSGLGITIVSTSKGVMTASNARRLGLGGEVICEVW